MPRELVVVFDTDLNEVQRKMLRGSVAGLRKDVENYVKRKPAKRRAK